MCITALVIILATQTVCEIELQSGSLLIPTSNRIINLAFGKSVGLIIKDSTLTSAAQRSAAQRAPVYLPHRAHFASAVRRVFRQENRSTWHELIISTLIC